VPPSKVIVATASTVASIVAYGSVSQEVWKIVEISVVVIVNTVAFGRFEEHAVLRIVG